VTVFTYPPISYRLVALVTFLLLVLPLGLTALTAHLMDKSSTTKLLIPPLVVCLPLAALAVYQIGAGNIAISPDRLNIQAGFYRTSVRLQDLRISEARILPADPKDPTLSYLRTNGVGLPGYDAGWFRLRNGRNAFVAHRGGDLVYVPTTGNFDLILGPENPETFLKELTHATR
jgi:Bacterial PH domain